MLCRKFNSLSSSEKNWKSVKIWRNYRHNRVARFFETVHVGSLFPEIGTHSYNSPLPRFSIRRQVYSWLRNGQRQTVGDGVRFDDCARAVDVAGRVATRRTVRREHELDLSLILLSVPCRVNSVLQTVCTPHHTTRSLHHSPTDISSEILHRGGFRHVQHVRPNRGPHKEEAPQKYKIAFSFFATW